MKKNSTIFLQLLVVLLGIGTLVLMLWFPTIEGRNVNSTLYEVYFNDPFLAYTYFASIAYFLALYKAFKLLGYIGTDKTFSFNSLKALRTIKYCAVAIVGFVAVASAYLFVFNRVEEDIAGGVALGFIIILTSVAVAFVARKFERNVQKNYNRV